MISTLAAFAAVAAFLTGCAHEVTSAPAPAPVVAPVVAAHSPAVHTLATADDYRVAFASLPQNEWAAADDAITVPISPGVTLWLFGDTMSKRANGFVHSTAVLQDHGTLTVVNHGAQLLPDGDAQHIYWIESGKLAAPGLVEITARAITRTGPCGFCFHDGGMDRTALLTVGPTMQFLGWTRTVHTATPKPLPLIDYGHGHIGYGVRLHPELVLADGHILKTTCQNWTDDQMHPMASYRPLFSDGPLAH